MLGHNANDKGRYSIIGRSAWVSQRVANTHKDLERAAIDGRANAEDIAPHSLKQGRQSYASTNDPSIAVSLTPGTATNIFTVAAVMTGKNSRKLKRYEVGFGDGTTVAANITPNANTHTYTVLKSWSAAGSYELNVSVVDEQGRVGNHCTTVTIPVNVGPTASFTRVSTGLSVAFTNTSTDTDGTIVSYAWNFGDTGTSADASPTHVYAAAGTYTVSLVVTDNRGATSTASTPVSTMPTAGFTGAVDGLEVTFTNTSVGDTLTYLWNFGDTETSTDEAPVHTYAAPGTYSVSLTVTDVNEEEAVALADVSTLPTASFTHVATLLSVAFTDTSIGDTLTYAWDFGDTNTSTDASPTHVYAAAGTYDVVLTVTDVNAATSATTPLSLVVVDA